MTRPLTHLSLVVAALALPAAVSANSHVENQTLNVTVMDGKGQAIGMAGLQQTPAGVLIDLNVKGLSPGEHAFHIHETGKCDASDGFKSAGGHFAPAKNPHGLMMAKGPHAGDMTNQFVGEDGILRAQVLNPNVTLGKGKTTLADADGSALVIHSGADDYKSQPSGDAGSRVACAVIFAPKAP